jgi:hypothetical protein
VANLEPGVACPELSTNTRPLSFGTTIRSATVAGAAFTASARAEALAFGVSWFTDATSSEIRAARSAARPRTSV